MLRQMSLVLVVFCFGCTASEPASTPAQTSHSFDLDGTMRLGDETIRYVVPDGYCLLDPNRQSEEEIYTKINDSVTDGARTFALFADCDQLEAFRTDQTIKVFQNVGGYFYMIDDDGAPKRGGMSRSRFARLVATEPSAGDLGEIGETVTSTGHTEDAAYFSYVSQDDEKRPATGGIGMTLIHDNVVGVVMIRMTDDPAAIPIMDEEVRALIDAFLDANPDSDN